MSENKFKVIYESAVNGQFQQFRKQLNEVVNKDDFFKYLYQIADYSTYHHIVKIWFRG